MRPNKRQLPEGVEVYTGRTWFILPIDAIEYILCYIEEHPDYVDFWKESLASDLMFFQTIIQNSPLNKRVEDELMYTHWEGRRNNHPLDISIEDDAAIEAGPFFCARKFNYADTDVVNYYLQKTRQ